MSEDMRVPGGMAPAPGVGQGNLIVQVTSNPALVLIDAEKFDKFYEAIANEARAHKPDLSTVKSRAAIASMARRVASAKTAIDDAGKKLNEEARERINIVDAARRNIRARMDALRDEVRKPLDEWEAAEELRIAECVEAFEWLNNAAAVGIDDNSDTVRDRLASVAKYDARDPSWGDYAYRIGAAKTAAQEALNAALVRIEREEADRLELARLRAEAEARAEADRIAAEIAQAEREAEQRAEEDRQAAARMAEHQARIAAQEAERQRLAIEAAHREAADSARKEAEAARVAQERAHADEVARLKKQAEEAEARRQADARRAADAETARLAEIDRAKKAEAARLADRAHRGKIMGAAKEALMEHCGLTDDAARQVILAIVAGSVPAVSVQF